MVSSLLEVKAPTSLLKAVVDKCNVDLDLIIPLSMSDELFPAAFEQIEFNADNIVHYCMVATKSNAALAVSKLSQEDIDENLSLWLNFPNVPLALHRTKRINLTQEQYSTMLQVAVEQGFHEAIENMLQETDYIVDDELLFTALDCPDAADSIKHLLKRANVNVKKDNVPFIIAAIKHADPAIVQLALETGKCDLLAEDEDNHNAMHYMRNDPILQDTLYQKYK